MSHQLLRFCVSFCLIILLPSLAAAQEICDNGLDDDADGLIDLNDTADCSCALPATTTSLLPNPSLEEFASDQAGCTSRQPGGLPDAVNQANCLVGWQRVSLGTTDSWNAFTLSNAGPAFPSALPQPLPSGTGVAGFWVGVRDSPRLRYRNGDGSFAANYREYLAACFENGETLRRGENYRLTFSLGFMEPQTLESNSSSTPIALSSPNPIELAIYGVRECGQLNFGEHYGCPEESEAAGYELITTVEVVGSPGSWSPTTVDFIPRGEYAGFAIGGSCRDDIRQPNGRGYRNYYFIDDLILNVAEAFDPPVAGPVSVAGQTICAPEITLRGRTQPAATYQWYHDGVALQDATEPVLVIKPSTTIDGAYAMRVTTPAGCAVTEPVRIQRPILYDQIADSVALCRRGQDVTIFAPQTTGATYSWSTGSTGPFFTTSEPGTYSVTVSTACLQRVEDFVVTDTETLSYRFTISPERPCIGDTVTVRLESDWYIPAAAYRMPDNSFYYVDHSTPPVQLVAGQTDRLQAFVLTTCGLQFEEIEIPELTPFLAEADLLDLNCHGPKGRISLTVPADEVSYTWTDPQGVTLAGNGPGVTALTSGTYTVALDGPDHCPTTLDYTLTDNDNFNLSVSATDVSCGNDATALALPTGGTPPYRVDWRKSVDESPLGASQPVARDLDRGGWHAMVTDSNGCQTATDFIVKGPERLRVTATADYAACHSDTAGTATVQVRGGTAPYRYATTTDMRQRDSAHLTGLTAGVHQVVVEDALGCTSYPYPVQVRLPATFALDAGPDREIAWGETVVLDATVDGVDHSAGEVRWTPDADLHFPDTPLSELRVAATPSETTTYAVTFTSAENCSRTDSVTVAVDRESRLYAPTAFSPNGDNTNDQFTLYTNSVVVAVQQLHIYDRWGNMVWEKPSEGAAQWDGTFGGQPVNLGVYVYQGKILLRDGSIDTVQGSVLLTR
ncbi:gliding motility-associated C-terminal domain-containing protein [Neolewinella maritima]|uniref:gliding motility-associated C-terminal domain-containing protein n=1 Tax=Neolewinella maritima TaxID=1383882 RepID=UPI001EE9AC95|nr:gliding motility-associated C-terminal domain-containing protein [Neolewinella maritima]